MSSFKLTGVGKLWLYADESSFGVSLTVNSSFIPISNLWRAKMSWNSTKSDSIFLISCCCSIESFQSKLLRNLQQDSLSSFGFSISVSCKLRSSVGIRFVSVYETLRLLGFQVPGTNIVRIGHYFVSL